MFSTSDASLLRSSQGSDALSLMWCCGVQKVLCNDCGATGRSSVPLCIPQMHAVAHHTIRASCLERMLFSTESLQVA